MGEAQVLDLAKLGAQILEMAKLVVETQDLVKLEAQVLDLAKLGAQVLVIAKSTLQSPELTARDACPRYWELSDSACLHCLLRLTPSTASSEPWVGHLNAWTVSAWWSRKSFPSSPAELAKGPLPVSLLKCNLCLVESLTKRTSVKKMSCECN